MAPLTKRNKYDIMNYFSSGYTDYMSDAEGGLGNKLKDRYAGSFSPDNPYARQIDSWERQEADKGKVPYELYSKAYEWEEKYTNAGINFALNDPLVTISRQRAAGINPDISGGSTGSSSSSGSSSAGTGMHGSSSFTSDENALDIARSSNIISAVSASGQTLNALASSFKSIAEGISTIKQTPGILNLQSAQVNALGAQANSFNANASYSNALANEVNTLLAGKQELQGIENASLIFTQLQSMYENGLITPESDIKPIISSMGVPAEKVDPFVNAFNQFMGTPRSQGTLSADKVFLNEQSAMFDVYTSEYFVNVLEKSSELNQLSLDGELLRQGIANRIQSILSNSNYAQDSADVLVKSSSLQSEGLDFSLMQLRGDILAYTNYLANMADERKRLVQKVQSYSDRLNSGDRKKRLNEREQIDFEFSKDAIVMIDSYGSSDCIAFNQLLSELNRNEYLNKQPYSLNGQDSTIQNVSLYWGQYVQGAYTKMDVADKVLNSVGQMLGVAAQVYMGKQIGSRGTQAQTITDYSMTNRGWTPTHQRSIR